MSPGINPDRISLQYALGEDSPGGALTISDSGELVVKTPLGDLVEKKPFASATSSSVLLSFTGTGNLGKQDGFSPGFMMKETGLQEL